MIGVCAVVGAALLFIPYRGMIGDGAFDLIVRVKLPADATARMVTCQVITGDLAGVEANARTMLALFPSNGRMVTVEPFRGEDVVVSVPFSEHVCIPPIGEPYLKSEWQAEGLIVLVELDNGRRLIAVTKIPHRKDSRSVVVEIPPGGRGR